MGQGSIFLLWPFIFNCQKNFSCLFTTSIWHCCVSNQFHFPASHTGTVSTHTLCSGSTLFHPFWECVVPQHSHHHWIPLPSQEKWPGSADLIPLGPCLETLFPQILCTETKRVIRCSRDKQQQESPSEPSWQIWGVCWGSRLVGHHSPDFYGSRSTGDWWRSRLGAMYPPNGVGRAALWVLFITA